MVDWSNSSKKKTKKKKEKKIESYLHLVELPSMVGIFHFST
jgi:hypothetical protein